MFARLAGSVALAALLLTPARQARADGQQALEDDLRARGAKHFIITPLTDSYLGRSFPDFCFFGVRFPQYPVVLEYPPDPLELTNAAAVDQDGQVTYLTTFEDERDFFFTYLSPATTEDQLRDACLSWLRLSEEEDQDGFFRFGKPNVNFARGFVTGDVAVEEGGTGSIRVDMTFQKYDGDLEDVTEQKKIRKGVRPICQATKLLDADPLVRRMAEQDIVVMGKACKGYLDEQKAKAKPELKKEIERVWKRICDEGR
jgi:hypothetical protein